MSYGSRFAGCATASLNGQLRRASPEYVLGSVNVRVFLGAAIDTGEARLVLAASAVHGSARGAFLAGIGSPDLNQRPASLFELISQHGRESVPALLMDRASEPAISADHVANPQVFQNDRAEAAGNGEAGLMPPISANSGCLASDAAQSRLLLPVAIGPPLPASESALRPAFASLKTVGGGCGQQFAGRQSNRVRYPTINAHGRKGGNSGHVADFAADARKPCPATMRNSHAQRTPAKGARQSELNPSDFGDANGSPFRIQLAKERASEHLKPEAVVLPFAAIPRKASAAKKCRNGAVKIEKRLRQHASWQSTDPIDLAPKLGDFAALTDVIDRPPLDSSMLPPKDAPLLKREIVNKPGHARELPEQFLLLGGGPQSVAGRPVNHRLFLAQSTEQRQ